MFVHEVWVGTERVRGTFDGLMAGVINRKKFIILSDAQLTNKRDVIWQWIGNINVI